MKNRLTALFAVILCLVVCLFAFVSCDGEKNTNDTTKEPEESTMSPNGETSDVPLDTTTPGGTIEKSDDTTLPANETYDGLTFTASVIGRKSKHLPVQNIRETNG